MNQTEETIMKQVEQIQHWLNHQALIQGFTTKKLGNLSFRTGKQEHDHDPKKKTRSKARVRLEQRITSAPHAQ